MRYASFVLFTVLSCVATAQTLDGINAPVSRTVTIPADEAAFTIIAAGSLDSTPQQVKQALQNAGLPNPTVVAIGFGPGLLEVPTQPRANALLRDGHHCRGFGDRHGQQT